MATKTHTSQKDPPEGSREVIERELKRQDKESSAARPVEHLPGVKASGQSQGGAEDRAKRDKRS